MNSRDNTNIRYHIFRELDRYNETKNERESKTVNSFVIPVFSGVLSTLIASLVQNGETELKYKIYSVFVFIIIFPILYIVSKKVTEFFSRLIQMFKNQNINKNQINDEEKRAAKVNYEVSHLVHLATSYMFEKTENEILQKYNRDEAIFHLTTSIRKLNKTLFNKDKRISPEKLSDNRIISIMEMMSFLLNEVDNKHNDTSIMNAITSYNHIVEMLKRIYGIELQQI